MNLNDLRAHAYGVSSKSDKQKTSGINDNPVMSAGQKNPQKTELEKTDVSFNSDNIDFNKKFNGKTTFDGVRSSENFNERRKTASENQELNAAEDILTSGGLLKVPVSERNADGSDSVYRRVAKFLLLIGVDEAAKILPHLTPEQTERIIPEIASIRSVSPEEASGILSEFQGLIQKARESGGVETARTILEKAYGSEQAQKLLDKAVPLNGAKPFDYLNDADCERIYFLLKDENPGVMAIVLSRLEPSKSAGVINQMSAAEKKDIVLRLAKMEAISPEVINSLDKAIHEKSLAQTSDSAKNIDGKNALASILKKMSPGQENTILTALSEDDPDLGQDLRSRLFTIDDVLESDERYIADYLREMSDKDVAYLIAGKPDAFRNKILNCVSQGRAAQILDEEEVCKPMRRKDCEQITVQFFSVLRRAWEDGKLIINNRTDDVYI